MFDENEARNFPAPVPPLILLGMHRSGTSVVANWLIRCGFNLGADLLGPATGNTEGHFEDRQILALHEQILRSNRISYQAAGPVQLRFNACQRAKAEAIYEQRKQHPCWGWKEPRTCLTMKLWQQTIPDHRCLVVFRDYRQVVDSFLRRKKKALKNRKSLVEKWIQHIKYRWLERRAANRFLKVWMEYNRQIVAHLIEMDPANYLVFDESRLKDCDCRLIQHCTQQWSYPLKWIPLRGVFKTYLMTRETPNYPFSASLIRQADQLTATLKQLEHQSVLKLLQVRAGECPESKTVAVR